MPREKKGSSKEADVPWEDCCGNRRHGFGYVEDIPSATIKAAACYKGHGSAYVKDNQLSAIRVAAIKANRGGKKKESGLSLGKRKRDEDNTDEDNTNEALSKKGNSDNSESL